MQFLDFSLAQGMNAPISKEAEAAYTTALNTLLGKDSSNKYHLHDTSVVFWSQKPTKLEQCVSFMFAPPSKDNPDKNVIFHPVSFPAIYRQLPKRP